MRLQATAAAIVVAILIISIAESGMIKARMIESLNLYRACFETFTNSTTDLYRERNFTPDVQNRMSTMIYCFHKYSDFCRNGTFTGQENTTMLSSDIAILTDVNRYAVSGDEQILEKYGGMSYINLICLINKTNYRMSARKFSVCRTLGECAKEFNISKCEEDFKEVAEKLEKAYCLPKETSAGNENTPTTYMTFFPEVKYTIEDNSSDETTFDINPDILLDSDTVPFSTVLTLDIYGEDPVFPEAMNETMFIEPYDGENKTSLESDPDNSGTKSYQYVALIFWFTLMFQVYAMF